MNSSPAFQLQLLGSASVTREDGSILTGRATQRHRLALLALLAAARGHAWTRDKLMAYLWPESDVERARNLLNVSVYVLRQTFGEHALLSDGDELRLNLNAIGVDVVEFENAVAAEVYERAVALYAGPFLDGFFLSDSPEFEKWVDGERNRLAAADAKVLEALAESAEQRRDCPTAVEWWKRRAAQDPYDSRIALRLVQALDAAGNPAGALQHAAIHRHLLQEEFGVEPPTDWLNAIESIRTRPAHDLATRSGNAETARAPAQIRESSALPSEASVLQPITTPASAAAPRRFRQGIRWGVVAAVLAALIFAASRFRREPAAPSAPASDQPSIAVLPLANLSGDVRDAPLADGMTEELIGILSRTGNLRVIASTSVFRFKNRQTDVRSIADSLRVSNVLEGGFQKIGSRLRVQVRLVDARDGSTRWSSTYDRELQDVFAVQDDIARSVARELNQRLGGNAGTRLRARQTHNVAAYELYLRGSDITLLRSDSGARAGLEYFKQAIALDSTYAAAYSGLARMYIRGIDASTADLPKHELYRLAATAARKAVVLDDSLSEAHMALAGVYYFGFDFASAEREAKRAIELDPLSTRPRELLVRLYIRSRRPEEALAQAHGALQIDPLSPHANAEVAHALLANHRCDEALAQLERVAALRPPLLRASVIAAQCYAQKQMWPEAIAQTRSLADRDGLGQAVHGYMLARAGQRAEALRIRDLLISSWQQRKAEASDLAIINAGFRDFDQTFLWLDRAVADFPQYLNVLEPMFEELHSDPRFARVYDRMVGQKR